MFAAFQNYFDTLVKRFGEGWNRFWFTPSDPLTLSVLRILTGIVALYVVGSYGFDLVRFFGPYGLLPIDTMRELSANSWRFSYLDYCTTPAALLAAHGVGMAILVCFTVGWYSRVTSVLALIVTLSYFHRGPWLTSEVDPILSLLLVYICLGPSGAYLSVDRCLAVRKLARTFGGEMEPMPPPPSFAANLSIRLIQMHLTIVFVMMVLGKLSGEVWWNGTAVWWLMTRVESRLVDMTWMHKWPRLLDAWTHAIVLFELSFAVLIWNRLARPLMLGIGLVMWSLLALITGMVEFSAVMVIASLAFVSPEQMRAMLSCCCTRAEAEAAEAHVSRELRVESRG